MPQVIFNPTAFVAMYPEFAAISPARLGGFFMQATLYLSNEDCSPVQSIPKRTILLNMLTAHVGQLQGALDISGVPGPGGQVLSASEGSVSASFANLAPQGGMAAWYAQTPYGEAFWMATAYLRSARFVPGPPQRLNGLYNYPLWRR